MSASRIPTAEPDRAVLVDLRGAQAGAVDRDVPALLRRAGRVPLIGLVDPALPDLQPDVRACLERTCPNAYAASRLQPRAFVSLAPRDEDPLFAARLLLDPALPSVGLERELPTATLPDALAHYWRARLDHVVPEAALWSQTAACTRRDAPMGALAVMTASPETPLCRALRRRGATLMGPQTLPMITARYQRVLFVLANTQADAPLLALLRRSGGDVLFTDSCLLAAYDDTAARRLASHELGRPVPSDEIGQWRRSIGRPAALLLGEAADAAAAVFVHSPWLAAEIDARYGRAATVLPSQSEFRLHAQASGLWAECCIWAVELLADWGVPVRLDLIGPPDERASLAKLAARLGIADRIGFDPGLASAALFLAMRGQASLSDALAQAAGTPIPCIATVSVAEATHAPAIDRLPDQPSPPLLAEAILRLQCKPAQPDAVQPNAVQSIYAALGLA